MEEKDGEKRLMGKMDIDADRLRVKLEMDKLALVGDFFEKDQVPFMKQAAAKIGGIHVHDLGNELTDGTRSKNPHHTGINIITEDNRLSLDRFWSEVRRLEAESKKPKGLISRLRPHK